MKAKDIRKDGVYMAKVSNKLVKVKVLRIRIGDGWHSGKSGDRTVYDVLNLSTNRQVTFRSAAKFRSEVTTQSQSGIDWAKENKSEWVPDVSPEKAHKMQSERAGNASEMTKNVVGPIMDKMVSEGVIPKPVDEYEINATEGEQRTDPISSSDVESVEQRSTDLDIAGSTQVNLGMEGDDSSDPQINNGEEFKINNGIGIKADSETSLIGITHQMQGGQHSEQKSKMGCATAPYVVSLENVSKQIAPTDIVPVTATERQ